MVADLELIKSKVQDLSRRWEVIQIYRGLDEEDGSMDWGPDKNDQLKSEETGTHYKPEVTKYPRFLERNDSIPDDGAQVKYINARNPASVCLKGMAILFTRQHS